MSFNFHSKNTTNNNDDKDDSTRSHASKMYEKGFDDMLGSQESKDTRAAREKLAEQKREQDRLDRI